MEHIEDMSFNMEQDRVKQESTSHSASACGIKEETVYCLSCSYSDFDFGRLKFHIFREHPTGAAAVANSFDKANYNGHDIQLFCVKETCSFSSTVCNIYEEHLMSCCMLHETLSEDERERLHSTVKFILDFHSKHNLKALPEFLDYVAIFNTTFTCKDDKAQINKDLECNSSSMLSGSVSDLDVSVRCDNTKFENSVSSFPTPVLLFMTQDFKRTVCKTENTSLTVGQQGKKYEQLSKPVPCNVTFASSDGETGFAQLDHKPDNDNIALEIDVAGSPVDINSLKEDTKGDTTSWEKTYYAECCTKDPHASSSQYGIITGMSTDHASDLHNDVMRMDRGHFFSDVTPDSSNLHCEMKDDTFQNIANDARSGLNIDAIQHKRNHTKEKPFKCNLCSKTFSWASSLYKHGRMHTGAKTLKCDDCCKTFNYNSELIHHRKMHTGEKPFTCNDCGKTFSQRIHLTGHRRTHTGEKPFTCNDCGKTFSERSHLTRHMRLHTGEKPFTCNDCGKMFSHKSTLIGHRRTHTGERPFKCNDCGKTFSYRSHLTGHERTHTGEEPFKCNDCGKMFSERSKLTGHKRTHT